MSRLQGKIAVITGGSSGVGLATAQRFAQEGAHVFITGRRQSELELQNGTTVNEFHAREVRGEEKQRYWAIAKQFWPPFPEYRRRPAARDIPIMSP